MAVAFDASSESHTGTTGSVSQASFNWTHTPVGTPRGVLVFTFSTLSSSDNATAVSYGASSMTAVSGGRAVSTGGTYIGDVKAWFLGSSVPTGAQTVTVTRTNNTDEMYAVAITVTAAADTSVHTAGIVLTQTSGSVISFAEQSVTDGQSSGTNNSVRFAGFNGSAGLVSTTSTTLPVDDTVYPGASSTHLQSLDNTNFAWMAVRETTAGIGARNVGFIYNENTKTTESLAAVHLAIKEGAAAAATAYPANLLAMFVAQEARNERATYNNRTGRLGQVMT